MAVGTATRMRDAVVRARAVLMRVPRWAWITGGSIAVVLLATWALGGFADAEGRARPVWQAGEPHDHGQVIATIHDYTVTTEEGQYLPEGAAAWLVVRASIVSTDDETIVYPRELVELPAGIAIAEDNDASPDSTHLIDLEDGRRTYQLHPDLPMEVAYLWPLADPGDAPRDGLPVEAIETQWIFSPSSNAWHWGGAEPVATMTIPYTDELPEALRGDGG